LNGTASARIAIRALNDGKVRINGGGVRKPVSLRNNDWFILEGFDVHNCAIACIHLYTGADNNIVRRVVAWDAVPDNGNSEIFGSHGNTGNLFEDVAGFGNARKIYQNSQGGNKLTIRRAWGRWERSTATGPKQVYSLVYNSVGAIYENVIGTWDASAMGGMSVTEPYGILSMDSSSANVCANAKYLGSIGYIRGRDKATAMMGVVQSNNDTECLTFQDVVAYIEPGTHSNIKPFSLRNDPGTSTNKLLKNITVIGGASSTIASQWQQSNQVELARIAISSTIWDGRGARVCKRYVDGTLTSEPLWPWLMNQRIINAMKSAGKIPVDVTKTMEQIFGPIPTACRSGSSTSVSDSSTLGVPAPPENLVIEE
jgi:hypothetical protein